MKREIESLKKKTLYLQLLITVILINVIFFLYYTNKTVLYGYELLQTNYRVESGFESNSSGRKSIGGRDSFQDSIASDCEDCEESKD